MKELARANKRIEDLESALRYVGERLGALEERNRVLESALAKGKRKHTPVGTAKEYKGEK